MKSLATIGCTLPTTGRGRTCISSSFPIHFSAIRALAVAQLLHISSLHTKRKLHGSVSMAKSLVLPQTFIHDYFSANTSIDRGWVKNALLAVLRSVDEKPAQTRRRRRDWNFAKQTREAKVEKSPNSALHHAQANVISSLASLDKAKVEPPSQSAVQDFAPLSRPTIIPPDASSQLTSAAAQLPSTASIRRSMATYLSLSKPRLSFLVVLTSTAAYSLYPLPEILSSTAALASPSTTFSASASTFAFLSTGTFLSSASANTLNMLAEPKYDALMSRTRNRPLVRNLVTPTAASIFAFSTGTAGLTLLLLGTNPTVAALSAFNIFLYAAVYTPLKRISVLNTWVGAVVGAIPPLMGWVAAAGQFATVEHHSWQDLLLTTDATGGWLLAALLFAWQFPHFNALSHSIRDEYRNAGYRMLAGTNPARNARVALRYSLLLFPISLGLHAAGIVNDAFLVLSTACNSWMCVEAYRFWRHAGRAGSARGLFWASIWSLPLLMVGGLVCKNGVWDGVSRPHSASPSALQQQEHGGQRNAHRAGNKSVHR